MSRPRTVHAVLSFQFRIMSEDEARPIRQAHMCVTGGACRGMKGSLAAPANSCCRASDIYHDRLCNNNRACSGVNTDRVDVLAQYGELYRCPGTERQKKKQQT